jgi:hypothetical protein
MFKVTENRCSECLFSPNKIVSDKRRKVVLNDCRSKDSYFICHKATAAGHDICCKGFYETQTCNLIRIAQRLDVVRFVPIPNDGAS